jgi:hypothetical protein
MSRIAHSLYIHYLGLQMTTNADKQNNGLRMATCQCLASYPGEEPRSVIDDLAVELGIDPKRLKGRVWRNGIGDPTGCIYCGKVYRSTVDSTSFHASEGSL